MGKHESVFLKERREALGLSQVDLSKSLGFANPQFVSNWERGKSSIPLKHVPKVSELLKIKPDVLVAMKIRDFEEKLKLSLKIKR